MRTARCVFTMFVCYYPFEYRLAISRCGQGASIDEVCAAIEEWRKPYMKDGPNIGSSIMMSAEAWQKVAKQSDDAAKKELLKDSRALRGVDELISKAEAAAEAARRAQAEFDRQHAELNAIPAKIDALNLKLADDNMADRIVAGEIVTDTDYEDLWRCCHSSSCSEKASYRLEGDSCK